MQPDDFNDPLLAGFRTMAPRYGYTDVMAFVADATFDLVPDPTGEIAAEMERWMGGMDERRAVQAKARAHEERAKKRLRGPAAFGNLDAILFVKHGKVKE